MVSLKYTKGTILIVEDEVDILELLEYHFKKEQFETIGFLSTKNVLQFLEEEEADILIIDRNLPGVEGSEFVKYIRAKGYDIPVIFLTAKSSKTEIQEGFLRGADDYITKPFNMQELSLRVNAILNRTKPSIKDTLIHRDIVLNQKTRVVMIGKEKIELTKLEFDLLACFLKNKKAVLKRDDLVEYVWQEDENMQEKTVNVAINRLNKKIDPDKTKKYIKSIWGVGYSLC